MKNIKTLVSKIKAAGLKKILAGIRDTTQERRLRRLGRTSFVKIDKEPLQEKIVFECQSDMDDNPRAIYEYMIAQGLNKSYKIVWHDGQYSVAELRNAVECKFLGYTAYID